MLVLSRKTGERILVPELGIEITVLSLGNQRVQIGIDAPPEIRIIRPDARRGRGCPVRRKSSNPAGAADAQAVAGQLTAPSEQRAGSVATAGGRARSVSDRPAKPELPGKYVVPV